MGSPFQIFIVMEVFCTFSPHTHPSRVVYLRIRWPLGHILPRMGPLVTACCGVLVGNSMFDEEMLYSYEANNLLPRNR